jgi:hypothetical protein
VPIVSRFKQRKLILQAICFDPIAAPGFDAEFFSTISTLKVLNGASRLNGLNVLNSPRTTLLRQPSVAYAGKFTGKNVARRTPNAILWEESVADVREARQ